MSIRISNYTITPHELFSNQEIIIDKSVTNHGLGHLKFEHCKLVFELQGSIKLENCTVNSCSFRGIENFHDFKTSAGFIELVQCKKFYKNSMEGQFRIAQIRDCEIRDFTDTSDVTQYIVMNTEINGFTIAGSCELLTMNQVRFLSTTDSRHSKWTKKIVIEAVCNRTIFENVSVDPYYLVTKCNDKTSLDLSTARLIDNWSKLRKRYAGLSLFIVFFLTFLFFLPLFTHSFFLITLSKLDGTLHIFKKAPLWEVLLFGGKSGYQAFIYCLLTIVLVLYNCGRIYMTISIAKLREEERFLKDANFNLVSISPEKFKLQILIDKVLQYMLYISVGYTLLKIYDALIMYVPSP